jgi:8-oxo-dGTP pyrophosphatase MutT (NUDIX family)
MDDGAVTRRERLSARVVLVDRQDRVLLVRLVDDGSIDVPGDAPPPTYWVTPGGGVEPGEVLEAAARREVFEETGITTFDLGPVLFERRVDLVLHQEPITQVEHYFAAWVEQATTSLDHLDPLEDGVLVEHRWWHRWELDADDRVETIYPRSIARLTAAAIAERRASAGG